MDVLIGEKAPLFTLRNQDKEEVSLYNLRGRPVLLVFFPLAFSSVCTEELCRLRDDLGQYQKLNAQVLGISADSVYALKAFKTTQQYSFPLLSDFNREVSRSYGCLHEEFALGMKEVPKRSVIVIDKDGIIRHKEILDNPREIPNFETVKAVLASLNDLV